MSPFNQDTDDLLPYNAKIYSPYIYQQLHLVVFPIATKYTLKLVFDRNSCIMFLHLASHSIFQEMAARARYLMESGDPSAMRTFVPWVPLTN
jgi:hypothetical protein